MSGDRTVATDKIAGHLLARDHPRGGAKARFFALFGFSETNPTVLQAALLGHPDENKVVAVTLTAFGVRGVVECHLVSPDGRNPCIRSVWMQDHDSAFHRLITAYPVTFDRAEDVTPGR